MADIFSTLTPMNEVGEGQDIMSTLQPVEGLETSALGNITKEELSTISRQTGVDEEKLRKELPWLGLAAEDASIDEIVEATAYLSVGEGVAMGAPAFLRKKSLNPEERIAFDKLRELGQQKRSALGVAAEIIPSLASGGGAVAGVGKVAKVAGLSKKAKAALTIGAGAAEGGAYGTFRSKEGDELEAFLTGAAIGGATLGAFETIPAIRSGWRWIQGASDLTQDGVEAGVSAAQRIARETEAELARTSSQAPFFEALISSARDQETSRMWQALNSIEGFKKLKDTLPEWVRKVDEEAIAELQGTQAYKNLMRRAKKVGATAEDVLELVQARNSVSELFTWKKGVQEGRWKEITEQAKQMGSKLQNNPQGLQREIETFRRQNIHMRSLRKRAKDESDKAGLLGKVWRFTADTQFVLQDIDDRFGTSLLPALNKLSGAQRQFESYVQPMNSVLNEVAKKAVKANINADDVGRALNATKEELPEIMKGKSAEFKQIVATTRNIYNQMRDYANEQGSRITRLADQGYLPSKMKQGPDLVEAFEAQARSMGYTGPEGMKRLGDDIRRLAKAEKKSKELQDALEISKDMTEMVDKEIIQRNILMLEDMKKQMSGIAEMKRAYEMATGVEVKGAKSLAKAQKALMSPADIETRLRAVEFAKAAAQRSEEGIPEFIREFNPFKLANTYMRQNVRTSIMRPYLTELTQSARSLRLSGKEESAHYVENLWKDIAGIRTDTWSFQSRKYVESFQAAARVRANAATTPKQKAFWNTMEELPDMMNAAMRQMYPYYMGMRLDAYLRNLTQPYLLTVGELNSKGFGSYGYKVSVGATADTFVQQMNQKQFNMAENLLREKGIIGPKFNFERVNYLKEGFEEAVYSLDTTAGRMKAKLGDWMEGATEASMYLYTKSDVQNRFVTLNMAQRVTKDLMSDVPAARAAIKENFPFSYQQRIEKAIKANKPDEVLAEINEYLQSRTQFNYDKVSLSEYGRYMGGVFSMFTKWPSSIAGEIGLGIRRADGKDIIEKVQSASKGLVSPKSMAKWWGPLMSLMAVEAIIPDAEKSDLRRLVLGRSDLYNWSPISSVGGLDIKPPMVDVGNKIVKGIVSGGFVEQLMEGNVGRAAAPFAPLVPGANYIRFLGRDLELYEGK